MRLMRWPSATEQQFPVLARERASNCENIADCVPACEWRCASHRLNIGRHRRRRHHHRRRRRSTVSPSCRRAFRCGRRRTGSGGCNVCGDGPVRDVCRRPVPDIAWQASVRRQRRRKHRASMRPAASPPRLRRPPRRRRPPSTSSEADHQTRCDQRPSNTVGRRSTTPARRHPLLRPSQRMRRSRRPRSELRSVELGPNGCRHRNDRRSWWS